MIRIVFLEDGDRPAGARHIDTPEAWIELRHIGTDRNGEERNRLVRVHVENGQEIVSLADEKGTVVFGIECHAMVSLTSANRILPHHCVCCRVNYCEICFRPAD